MVPRATRRQLLAAVGGAVGTLAGCVTALPGPSRSRWSFTFEGGVADAGFAADTLHLSGTDGDGQGRVVALSPGDGSVRAHRTIVGRRDDPPTLRASGASVYVWADDGLRVLDESHETLWTFPRINSLPLVADGVAYLLGARDEADSVVHALDAATGHLRWRYAPPDLGFPVFLVDGVVVCVADYGEVFGLAADTGERLWTVRIDGQVPPIDHDADTVYVGSDNEADGAQGDGAVTAIEAATGSVRWRYLVEGTWAGPHAAGDVVYAASVDTDAVHAVDAETGDRRWRRVPEGIAAYAGDRALLLERRGGHPEVVAYGPDGRVRWRYARPDLPTAFSRATGDRVVLGDGSGRAFVLSVDTGGLLARYEFDSAVTDVLGDERGQFVVTESSVHAL